ncbi:pPIWI-associating nuclease domain-containing protein [Neorhodopirellula pilleata]|uniref:Predicted pPIWI-associating nuclease domain-containing protein n=1 Tax=Neorhodopirellula pilleata TaxID=2714738 RepID=A0A5C6APR8_9BACT|nr:hypothetical protein [Neorhodopirellula pilleata]TWU01441.1 hypothetical protein Pla100_11700 [Neorhodopirellula pilleata]
MDESYRELERATRDISRSMTAYTDMVRQIQLSSSAFTSIQETLAKQLSFDQSLMRSTSSLLSEMKLNALVTTNFSDLANINLGLTDLVSQASISNSAISKVFAEHNVLRESLASFASQKSAISDLLSSLDTTRLLHTSLTSQYRLLDLETHSFGKLLGANTALANELTSTFGKFTRSYREVIESIPTLPKIHIPTIAKYSPIEYSLELEILERISLDDEEAQENNLEGLPDIDAALVSFDDRLLALINGARQALSSENPDRARHVTTSVRELFTQVLHGLAPDEEIKVWTSDKSHFHNNRPTRRARLLYICRRFSCDPLTKFVEDDVRAALTLVDSLNAGTHVVESKLTPFQLEAIVYRMESLALFLLKISQEDK